MAANIVAVLFCVKSSLVTPPGWSYTVWLLAGKKLTLRKKHTVVEQLSGLSLELKVTTTMQSGHVKGDLSCKMHFCTSFIHEYVSPVCQGTHQVSENTTLSLFFHTQISKNGAATDLIHTDTDLKIL